MINWEEIPGFPATDCFAWEEKNIVDTYAKRWTIDTFYRDTKQNLGLEEYELRDKKGIRRHQWMVFPTYTLLQLKTNLKNRWWEMHAGRGRSAKIFHLLDSAKEENIKNMDEVMWRVFASRQKLKSLSS